MAKLIKRIECGAYPQGYVIKRDDGSEEAAEYLSLMERIQNKTLVLENAKLAKSSLYGYTLRGVGCSLQKLPVVALKYEECEGTPLLRFGASNEERDTALKAIYKAHS